MSASRIILILGASVAVTACGGATAGGQAPAAITVVTSGVATPASTAQTPVPVAAAAPASGFDAVWYAAQYPDIVAAKLDPLTHYNQYGRWEGRLPYAGATPWRPSTPADYESAPACAIDTRDVWAPAGSRTVRVRFRLTRFGGIDPSLAVPCERSFSIRAGGTNPNNDDPASVNGVTPMNISGQPQMLATGEALSLPSTGSQGELVFNIPDSVRTGYFRGYLLSVEYGPRILVNFNVIVGGTQPANADYWPAPLVLPSATPAPTSASLGTPSFSDDFLGNLWANGWMPAEGPTINSMIGYFARQGTVTKSGATVDAYPIVTDASGARVRAIRIGDHRGDPVMANGAGYDWSTGLLRRTLGDGRYGFRETIIGIHPMPGTDAALWGISSAGGWPPEFDTEEDFVETPERVHQSWHPRSGAPSLPFAPAGRVSGKHDWKEQWTATTYRLWLDDVLLVERPNYGYQESMTTVLSIEGPGGAGGGYDAAQHYDGLQMELYGVKWWQR